MPPAHTIPKSGLKALRALLGIIAAIGIFLVATWFKNHPVWNEHFDAPGPIYLVYNLLRICAALYLLVVLYGGGDLVCDILKLKARFGLSNDGPTRGFIVRTLIGAALITVFYYGFGLIGWITRETAVTFAVLITFYTFAFSTWLDWCHLVFASIKNQRPLCLKLKFISAFNLLLLLLVGLTFATYVIAKCLYPNFDGDAFTHYMPYYLEVLRRGNILPNNVWYHFFYSKGCGLFFFISEITDRNGPSLVCLAFLVILVGMIWDLIRHSANDVLWALLVLYFAIADILLVHPDLIMPLKQHFVMGTLFMAFLWYNLSFDRDVLWINGILLTFLVLFTPTAIGFAGPLFFLFMLERLIKHDKAGWKAYLSVMLVGTAVLVFVMALNYSLTGMYEINPFRLFWAHADQIRFSKWTSPYMMLLLHEGSNPSYGTFRGLISSHFLDLSWYREMFRLEFFGQVLSKPAVWGLGLVLTYGVCTRRLRLSGFNKRLLFFVTGFLAICELNRLVVTQTISFLRLMEFSIFFILILTSMFYKAAYDFMIPKRLRKIVLIAIVVFISATAYKELNRDMMRNYFDFLIGKMSFSQTKYGSNQTHFLREVYDAKIKLGTEQRIFSLQTASGAIGYLPGRNVETEINFSYKKWHRFVFDNPPLAKAALTEEGLKYFLINFDTHSDPSFLQYAPLFQRDALKQNFAVAYHKQGVYVLTWRNQNDVAQDSLPKDFMDRWNAMPDNKLYKNLYDRLRFYYAKNGENYPIHRDPTLPQLPGWQ